MTTPETNEVLLPRERFQVRPLRDQVRVFRNGYVPLSGFGIFDLVAGGWVCMSKPIEIKYNVGKPLIHLPYCLKRKYVVEKAISEGLWSGYQIVKPEDVMSLRDAIRRPIERTEVSNARA